MRTHGTPSRWARLLTLVVLLAIFFVPTMTVVAQEEGVDPNAVAEEVVEETTDTDTTTVDETTGASVDETETTSDEAGANISTDPEVPDQSEDAPVFEEPPVDETETESNPEEAPPAPENTDPPVDNVDNQTEDADASQGLAAQSVQSVQSVDSDLTPVVTGYWIDCDADSVVITVDASTIDSAGDFLSTVTLGYPAVGDPQFINTGGSQELVAGVGIYTFVGALDFASFASIEATIVSSVHDTIDVITKSCGGTTEPEPPTGSLAITNVACVGTQVTVTYNYSASEEASAYFNADGPGTDVGIGFLEVNGLSGDATGQVAVFGLNHAVASVSVYATLVFADQTEIGSNTFGPVNCSDDEPPVFSLALTDVSCSEDATQVIFAFTYTSETVFGLQFALTVDGGDAGSAINTFVAGTDVPATQVVDVVGGPHQLMLASIENGAGALLDSDEAACTVTEPNEPGEPGGPTDPNEPEEPSEPNEPQNPPPSDDGEEIDSTNSPAIDGTTNPPTGGSVDQPSAEAEAVVETDSPVTKLPNSGVGEATQQAVSAATSFASMAFAFALLGGGLCWRDRRRHAIRKV